MILLDKFHYNYFELQVLINNNYYYYLLNNCYNGVHDGKGFFQICTPVTS